jgi:hypothetical protein
VKKGRGEGGGSERDQTKKKLISKQNQITKKRHRSVFNFAKKLPNTYQQNRFLRLREGWPPSAEGSDKTRGERDGLGLCGAKTTQHNGPRPYWVLFYIFRTVTITSFRGRPWDILLHILDNLIGVFYPGSRL